ncbi:hypothetical protein CAPTEDRAFT_175465 [Capitella teleta]|uniref:RRM domain-containing protein n=1 Tax=Capitella teleta TaxID=283909 RepID=R7V854_CAPTE|nr:hypothetical protein CAPTEDRAFT_175465 [Capitella teleta]|eukprot:ELU12551.1 hypothetical protein CAPTEDRAFT_175465 [Capitella teleta]
MRKLFIGGLNISTTDESLREYFSAFGTIEDCVVLKDSTGRSRCFGFVVYSSSAIVDIAQASRPHVLDGKTVDTKRATPKGETTSQTVKKIFVGGLSRNTTKESIQAFFEQFGGVSDVDCPLDQKSGLGRGFAYVTFNDSDPVDKVSLIHYHMIDGRRCEAKKALSKQEMSQQRGGGSMGRGGGGGGGRGGGSWGRGGGGGGGRGRGRGRGGYGGAPPPSYGGQSSWGNGGGGGGWGDQSGYGESTEQWSGDSEWTDGSQGWYSNGATASWNTGGQDASWGGANTAGGPMRDTGKFTQRYGGPYGQSGGGTEPSY